MIAEPLALTSTPFLLLAIPPIRMPDCAEDWTGKMALGDGNLSYWIPLRPQLTLRFNTFPKERATVAIDPDGRTLVCWGVQELPSPWTRDRSIELPRSPNID